MSNNDETETHQRQKMASTPTPKRWKPRFDPLLTYEAPGLELPPWLSDESSDDDDNESIDNDTDSWYERPLWSAPFSLQRSLPPLESLVGTYDLIFFSQQFSYSPGDQHHFPCHHVISGTMKCTLDEKQQQDPVLLGEICLHGDASPIWEICGFCSDFNLTIEGDGTLTHNDLEFGYYGGMMSPGKASLLSESRVVRYMPECLDGIPEEVQRDYASSISEAACESVENAKAALAKYAANPLLWLDNHMGLPDKTAALIRSFVTEKPPPVFIFEKGDMHLRFHMEDEAVNLDPTFILRKR